VSKTPILPLSIISTSFPGIALMDYKKKEEEELDLVKDNALRVCKRYNHWSYVLLISSVRCLRTHSVC
jgi:bZIP factor